MYYLRDGLKRPGLAWIYALVAGVAALTTTPFTQTNSIALVLHTTLGVPTWGTGVAVAVLTWLVIIGGIKSIGRAAEKLTPLKVGLYLAGGIFVIVSFASHIPEVLALVVREAFSTRAVAGGSLGFLVAMRYGLARGMYANEAGYGTAAVAYGTAQSRSAGAAGTERGDGGVHRLVRDVDHFGDDDSADRRLAVGPDEHGGGGAGLRRGDSRRRRLSRRGVPCSCSATRRSSAGRTTASSSSSTSSGRAW